MPGKRRGQGEGSLYWNERRQRWQASISLEGRKRKTVSAKTRKEAATKLAQLLRDQEQGTLTTGGQQKLKDFLEQWLEEVKKPNIKPLTYQVYQGILSNHLIPALGHLQVQKLTPQHVQRLLSDKRKEGLESATIGRILIVLKMALSHAVKLNLVVRNACDPVDAPRVTHREQAFLTPSAAQQLLRAARGHWIEPMLLLAITTGLREGEILGLHWEDINFLEQTIHVRRTVARVGRQGIIAGTPKTELSKRTVSLPVRVVRALKAHREQQADDSPLVFSRDGTYISASSVTYAFRKLVQDSGLPPIRFHDLRHSAVSLLLDMGVPVKEIKEMMGHSSINMTMDTYGHLMPGAMAKAMEKWDTFFD